MRWREVEGGGGRWVRFWSALTSTIIRSLVSSSRLSSSSRTWLGVVLVLGLGLGFPNPSPNPNPTPNPNPNPNQHRA